MTGSEIAARPLAHLRGSIMLRLLGIAGLILLLRIPVGLVSSTIRERQQTRNEAVGSVTQSWGRAQTVSGPFIVVPFVQRFVELKNGKRTVNERIGHKTVLPNTLTVEGVVETEIRRRGIFDVPLYVARLRLDGSFSLPELDAFPEHTDRIQWDRATIVLGLSDPRAIRDSVDMRIGATAIDLQPGNGGVEVLDVGLHGPIDLAKRADVGIPFAISLAIAGSGALAFLPTGGDTTVHLQSSWSDPSFVGAYLPATRNVTTAGFEASWRVPHLARTFPASWNRGEMTKERLEQNGFGVQFLSPVDAYRTTERAVKYQLLFVGLTFVAFLLFELLAALRIHPVQYLLVGLALCLFYLLLLSLAEHIGFGWAYVVAAIAVTGLITTYVRIVLGTRGRTLLVTAQLGGLYAYLYVLLQIEDYALLAGSLVLFVILAAIMLFTRRVDWYDLGTPASAAG